jgi:hypothetical protein
MLGQQPVEQHLVAVAHVGQEDVLGQIIGLASVLGVNPPQLALQCSYAAGQQALQPSSWRCSGANAVPRLSMGFDSTDLPRARIRTG